MPRIVFVIRIRGFHYYITSMVIPKAVMKKEKNKKENTHTTHNIQMIHLNLSISPTKTNKQRTNREGKNKTLNLSS